MAAKRTNRFWRIARVTFRWCRIFVWMVLLAAIVALIYLNSIGLPDFLKTPLLAELRGRGWEVEFSRMRWHWFRGILIENATFSSVDKEVQSNFSTGHAELDVDFTQILDSKVALRSLLIRKGEFTTTLETNSAPLLVEKIQAKIHFHPDDRLTIEPFEAQFRGIHFQLSCDLTNASALRELSFLLPEKKPSDAPETAVKNWFEMTEQIHFVDQPEVSLAVSGDLRDWKKMRAELKIATLGATTPWGRFEGVGFNGGMNPPGATNFPVFAFKLDAADLQSEWGTIKTLQHQSQFSFSDQDTNVLDCEFELIGSQVRARWVTETATNLVHARKVQLSGVSALSLTNFHPLNGSSRVNLRQANVRLQHPGQTNVLNAALNQADLSIEYDPSLISVSKGNEDEFGFWAFLQPFTFSGRFNFGRLADQRLNFDKLLVSADWAWPRLEFLDIQSTLYNGEFEGRGSLDVVSREVALNAKSSFDIQKLAPLLPEQGQLFLAQCGWEKPPRAECAIHFLVPAWNNPEPDLQQDVLPTLQINGRLEVENGRYRGTTANRVSTDVLYSNMVWNLPNVRVIRPEGELNIALVADDRAFTFDATVKGSFDPNMLRSQLAPEQEQWLNEVSFSKAPFVELRVIGNWGEFESVGVEGNISAQEFVCRDVEFSSISSKVYYTNQVLQFDDVFVERHDKQIKADQITLNLQTNRIYFNDVASTIDPMLVADIIGEQVVKVLSPYKFGEPPHVLLNGSLGLRTIADADMHFEIAGKDFRWGLLHADAGSGRASWVNETLILTNLNALAYGGGTLQGNAFLNFAPQVRADYSLEVTFSDVDVRSVVLSLDGTNQVDGVLSGALTVRSADTTGLHTWDGYGHAELKDGLIWEMPIFGLFTPILDAIVPGLGKTRARSANAHFIITNGVAFSDDLEIRSSAFRMQYRGTLNHELEVNARVMAEPLRDTWALGKAISTALMPISKLFEYKVTGPVYDPEMKPVYVPKVIMMTLRPFNTLKKLLESEDETVPVPQP